MIELNDTEVSYVDGAGPLGAIIGAAIGSVAGPAGAVAGAIIGHYTEEAIKEISAD